MEVKFTRDTSALLYLMLRQPQALGQGAVPYKAADELAALEVIAIQRFTQKHLTKPSENAPGQVTFIEYAGNLRKSAVQRIKQILEHFKESGLTSVWAADYWALKYMLDGKDLEIELSDPSGEEEVVAPKA